MKNVKLPTRVPPLPSAAAVREAMRAVEAGDAGPGLVVLAGLAMALDRAEVMRQAAAANLAASRAPAGAAK